MSFDLTRILQSKRAFRQQLAARPIEEKLAMLDALRERELTLRASRNASGAGRGKEPAVGNNWDGASGLNIVVACSRACSPGCHIQGFQPHEEQECSRKAKKRTSNIQTRSAERGARKVLREGGEGRRLRMEDGDWSAKLEFRTDSLAVSSYLRPCHQLSSNHLSTNLQHPASNLEPLNR
jgi:hypothetical protein